MNSSNAAASSTSPPPIFPVNVAEIILQIAAINAKETDFDEDTTPDGYQINFLRFKHRFLQAFPDHGNTIRSAYLAARTYKPAIITLYQHHRAGYPHSFSPPPAHLQPMRAFDFVRTLDINISWHHRGNTQSIMGKIFTVCLQLHALHVVLRITDGHKADDEGLGEVGQWLAGAEAALRGPNTANVKTLDLTPARLAHYPLAPRAVRIGFFDERSYIEQVNPFDVALGECTTHAATEDILRTAKILEQLKINAGFDVSGWRWIFTPGQEIPRFLVRMRKSCGQPDAEWNTPLHEIMTDRLEELMDGTEINRLHWEEWQPIAPSCGNDTQQTLRWAAFSHSQ